LRELTREDKVAQFMRVMKQPVEVQPNNALLELRYKLIKEEFTELGEEIAAAMTDNTMRGSISNRVKQRMLKEMADLQYVLSGLAVTLGLDLGIAFNRVHSSNMSKLDENGKPIFREDGKVLKGPNYKAPDLEDLVSPNEVPGYEYYNG